MELIADRTAGSGSGATARGGRLMAAAAAIVALNLVAAFLVDTASDKSRFSAATVALIGLALAVNVARFLLWRSLHRRFRFVDVLPLTALFFPLVAAMSWMQGEPLSPLSAAGVAMITLGAWSIAKEARPNA